MVKHKTKRLLLDMLKSGGTSAAAVVLLVVSIGISLPLLFAQTQTVPTVIVKPLSTSDYSVQLSWSGTSGYGFWHYRVLNGSQIVSSSQATSGMTAVVNNLTCGVNYTFEVANSFNGSFTLGNYGQATGAATCPSAAISSFTASASAATATWVNKAGFDTSYTAYFRQDNTNYVATNTTGTSFQAAASCGHSYSLYVIATGGRQSGPASAVATTKSPACSVPVVTPPKPVVTKPSVPTSTTKSGTGSSSKSTSKTTPSVVTAPVPAATVPVATAAPVPLVTTPTVKPPVIYRSVATSTISNDKAVKIAVPAGAAVSSIHCAVVADKNNLGTLPAHQQAILGAYGLVCVDADNNVITDFHKPVTVTINVGSVANYKAISAQTPGSKGWTAVKSSYNPKTGQLSFQLTAAKTFAAFGQKKSNHGAIWVSLSTLLIVAVVLWIMLRRRRPAGQPIVTTPPPVARPTVVTAAPPARPVVPLPPPPAPTVATPHAHTAQEEFLEAVARPDCSHLHLVQHVQPSSPGCLECTAQHKHWKALRICLICGHVGCSDDSSEQHAMKHFQQTGHPLIYDYADPNGNNIGWCYLDKTYI